MSISSYLATLEMGSELSDFPTPKRRSEIKPRLNHLVFELTGPLVFLASKLERKMASNTGPIHRATAAWSACCSGTETVVQLACARLLHETHRGRMLSLSSLLRQTRPPAKRFDRWLMVTSPAG